MSEIKCPNCGEVFQVDESDYGNMVRQVRDAEFEREIAERSRLMEQALKSEIAAAVAREREHATGQLATRDKQISELASQIERNKDAVQLARIEAVQPLQQALAEAERRVSELTAQIESQARAFEAERKLAISEATSQQQLRITALEGTVRQAKVERQQVEESLRREMLEQARYKDQTIADRDDEIERLRNQRSRLSTKLIGETLEQHCEIEFERMRSLGFRSAEFHKDNNVVGGTKGDYIFREFTDDGVEVVSIMFEMKNEDDLSAHASRHRNVEFLAKLDKDRRNKNCEYAVLVSTLEPDSDLYNTGIVDMSHLFDKTYVIRPQFFVPMITLLRNAALNSVTYRRQLVEAQRQNIEITAFEEALEDFKMRFGKNYETASRKFSDAIDEIDKAIARLQKVKEFLTSSENQLRLANKKADELTIRRLTRNSPDLRKQFAEAKANGEAPQLP